MNTCLMVIDAQESFRHRDYHTDLDFPAYLTAQNQLIAGAARQSIPIIRIFHCDGPSIANAGLLKGIRATTHHTHLDELRQTEPLSRQALPMI